MPRLPSQQLDPGPVRHPEMMWLHWTINLMSWIIECIQIHPVVLQPVPPPDQFPTEEAYHHFRDFRILLMELGIIRDRLDSALRHVQEIPHDDLAALTRTWHHANISYMQAFRPAGHAPQAPSVLKHHEMDHHHLLLLSDFSQLRNTDPLLLYDSTLLEAVHALHHRVLTKRLLQHHGPLLAALHPRAPPAGRAGHHASLWQATHGRRDPVTSFPESPP